jgi:hypothetical protein
MLAMLSIQPSKCLQRPDPVPLHRAGRVYVAGRTVPAAPVELGPGPSVASVASVGLAPSASASEGGALIADAVVGCRARALPVSVELTPRAPRNRGGTRGTGGVGPEPENCQVSSSSVELTLSASACEGGALIADAVVAQSPSSVSVGLTPSSVSVELTPSATPGAPATEAVPAAPVGLGPGSSVASVASVGLAPSASAS